MSFNPDPNKQAVEVIFSHKLKPINHPVLIFNDSPVVSSTSQKHLGLILDSKLNFNDHLKEKISKANRGIGIIKRLYCDLPRKSLLNIYTSYIRPNLDYSDIIYDMPNNSLFLNRIESVQYNACLAITGAIRGTSKERLYQELGLEWLSDRRKCRRLIFFSKIVNGNSPQYLKEYIPRHQFSRDPTRSNLLHEIFARTDNYKNSFFPYCVKEWNNLNKEIKCLKSISKFKNELMKFFRPERAPIYNIHDPIGLKYLTRIRVNLSENTSSNIPSRILLIHFAVVI